MKKIIFCLSFVILCACSSSKEMVDEDNYRKSEVTFTTVATYLNAHNNVITIDNCIFWYDELSNSIDARIKERNPWDFKITSFGGIEVMEDDNYDQAQRHYKQLIAIVRESQ